MSDTEIKKKDNELNLNDSVNKKNVFKFIIPSLVGVALFLCPIPTADGLNIMIAVITSTISNWMAPVMPYFVYAAIIVSGVGTLIIKLFKPSFIINRDTLNRLFNVSWIWVTIRVLGAAIAIMCMIGKGPEMFISEDTGTFLIYVLLVYWVGTILIAGTLMDLLLNYGLMEFIGTFMSKIMRPIFKLPGRCAIDCLVSWLGDAIIGILITTTQYQQGFYNRREAATIATTFSAVSISFSLLVAAQLQISHMFLPFFLVTLVTGFICGIIMPRIWPLTKMPDTYLIEGKVNPEQKDKGHLFKKAVGVATKRSETESLSPLSFVKKGLLTTFEVSITCMPTVMLIGTVSLILSYYTPFFTWLGVPFEPVLSLLNVPEAQAASECILAGFGDMFIPSVLASSTIDSEFTRFFIGVLSITQLIYMSEVGALLLSSKLPIKFTDLVVIFLERTIICIPVILLLMNIFVY